MSLLGPPRTPRLPQQLGVWDGDIEAQLELDGALLTGADLAACERIYADASKFEKCIFTGANLSAFAATDVVFSRSEAAAMRGYKANLLRVQVSDSRFSGAEFAEGSFEDCTFKNVKFDEAGFRFASFKRVVFEDCVLRNADLSNAKFSHVVFRGCELEGASFVSADCTNVDVSTENLAECKGITGLKGATISELQLIQLAPLFASELGFRIKTEQ